MVGVCADRELAGMKRWRKPPIARTVPVLVAGVLAGSGGLVAVPHADARGGKSGLVITAGRLNAPGSGYRGTQGGTTAFTWHGTTKNVGTRASGRSRMAMQIVVGPGRHVTVAQRATPRLPVGRSHASTKQEFQVDW